MSTDEVSTRTQRAWSSAELRVLARAEQPEAREADIQDAIELVLGNPLEFPDVWLYRNNVGVLVDPHTQRHVRFGVGGKGGADLIGMFTLGLESGRERVARFIAAEVKTRTGVQSPEQVQFQQLVEARGGSYRVLRSVREARAWIRELRGEV